MSGRRIAIGLLFVTILMIAPGCIGSGRLTPAAQKQLHGAADTAEARAKAFPLWSSKVKAKDAGDEAALQRLIKSHNDGLKDQAAALRSLSNAIKKK